MLLIIQIDPFISRKNDHNKTEFRGTLITVKNFIFKALQGKKSLFRYGFENVVI